MARGHPPPHCENTQVLREAISDDDDDDDDGCFSLGLTQVFVCSFRTGTCKLLEMDSLSRGVCADVT